MIDIRRYRRQQPKGLASVKQESDGSWALHFARFDVEDGTALPDEVQAIVPEQEQQRRADLIADLAALDAVLEQTTAS